MSTEQAQKTMSKMLEWYGDKETYMDVATHPLSAQVTEAYGKRFESIRRMPSMLAIIRFKRSIFISSILF